MILLIFLILGLIIGSFLNVLVSRIHSGEGIFWDRSKCPNCKKIIRWYDNIPLASFFILKAQCRDCRKKISWQYPIIEGLTGLIFVLISARFFELGNSLSWLITAYYLFIASALITIVVYDCLYMEIPTIVLWSGITGAIVASLILDGLTDGCLGTRTYFGAIGALMSFSFFFLISALSKEKWMGMGDAYLSILLGLFLGWPSIILALFMAFLIGSAYGILAVISGQKKMKSRIPFAPFLVAGTFISFLFYDPIVNWYLSLIY